LNKIISKKTTSAIFLATVLVLGTIAVSSPSFMTRANAQADSYYEMDNRYDSYEPTEYTDNNSYEPTEYPSYKPEYPSDNRDYKSKKDSSNTIVKKVKCNNINSNNNGVNVNLGLPNNDALVEAQAADNEGQATTANGWGNDERNKQNGNDFKFVCINNNDNENNIIETTPEPIPPDTITCEECFTENLTPEQLAGLNSFLEGRQPVTVDGFDIGIAINDLAAYCTLISLASTEESLSETVRSILLALNERVLPPEDAIPEPIIEEIIQCVLEALDIETNDISGSLTASNINTDTSAFDINTSGGLASSFSSQPTITQGTEDSSALAKVAKLKQQWLDLLP
jgi:hypothetical protein